MKKKMLGRCTALLTAGVLVVGAFSHLFTQTTKAAYSFVGQDYNTTTDITIMGKDTGLDYTRVHLGSGGASGYGANRYINILEADLKSNDGLSMEVINHGTTTSDSDKLTNVVSNYSEGGKQILAAVNGDWMSNTLGDLESQFTKANYKVSFSPILMDGEIWCSQMTWQEKTADYFTFGVTTDKRVVVGKPEVNTTITNTTKSKSISANGVNRAPGNNALYVYNNRLAASNYVPDDAYEVAIQTNGSNKFMNNGTVSGTVIGLYPANSASRQALGEGVVVLTARGYRLSELRDNFAVGDTVNITTTITDSTFTTTSYLWKSCEEAIGGQLMLLKDGEQYSEITSTAQYPTNVIGLKDDGSVMIAMVTADSHGVRTGLKYNEIYKFCQDIGYKTCFMLDGGGSTTMVTLDGASYVERACYSDGTQRSTWNSIAFVYDLDIPKSVFDYEYYYNRYSDLRTSVGYNEGKLFRHFINSGIAEGRQGSPIFDVTSYINDNPDNVDYYGDDKYLAIDEYITYDYEGGYYYTARGKDLGETFDAKINLEIANLTVGVSGTNAVTVNTSDNSDVWTFKRNDDTSYQILHKDTEKALALSGTDILLKTASASSSAQKWFLYDNLDGTYSIRCMDSHACVLSVANASTTAGASMEIAEYMSVDEQRFTLTTVVDQTKNQFVLNSDSTYDVDTSASEWFLLGVEKGTTAADIAAQFKDTVKIYDRNGNEVTGAPASGYTIKKIVDGAVTCSATVIVTGDYNGDGIVNGIDLLRARKALDGSSTSGYFKAIDVDRNGTLSAADVKAVAEIVIK